MPQDPAPIIATGDLSVALLILYILWLISLLRRLLGHHFLMVKPFEIYWVNQQLWEPTLTDKVRDNRAEAVDVAVREIFARFPGAQLHAEDLK